MCNEATFNVINHPRRIDAASNMPTDARRRTGGPASPTTSFTMRAREREEATMHERRLRAIESAIERADVRTNTLAKLVKCARDAEEEDAREVRAVVEKLRDAVERRGGDGRARRGGDRVCDDDDDVDEANARRRSFDARAAYEAFERRMDARLDRMMEIRGGEVRVEPRVQEPSEETARLRAEVKELKEALTRERAEREADVERLEYEISTLREALLDARERRRERNVDADVDAATGRRSGRRTMDEMSRGTKDEDVRRSVTVDDDEIEATPTSNARPELEARRRRLRALYTELQTLSF
jgi:hypothetical protein